MYFIIIHCFIDLFLCIGTIFIFLFIASNYVLLLAVILLYLFPNA